jgi:hypothetical protein
MTPHAGRGQRYNTPATPSEAQSFAIQKLCGFLFPRINKYVTFTVFRTYPLLDSRNDKMR